MLDHYWKGRGCLHLMEWMCRTLHTPNTFPACLIEHLVNSGRGDLVTQLIEHMTCLQLSQGLQSNQQTMQVVYHAKQSMCASHKTSLLMFSSLGLPQSIHSHEVHINNLQEVVRVLACIQMLYSPNGPTFQCVKAVVPSKKSWAIPWSVHFSLLIHYVKWQLTSAKLKY